MKNKKCFILLMMILFLTTGCVREKIDLTIHKDKSMDLSMDMGISKTFMEAYKQQEGTTGGNDLEFFDISDEEIAEMKKKGINVEKYDDGSYTGMKAFLKITNIDVISSTKEVEGDLEAIVGFNDDLTDTEKDTEEKFLFTVKKGFLKNKYTAKLSSSTSDEIKDMTDLYTDTDATINNGNNNTTGNGTNNVVGGNSSTNDFDFSTLASGMDMSFTVNLPYKAISNNATTVENDGKKLSWNLANTNNAIEFSFELYNMRNIYLLGGGILLIVLILIVGIVLFVKKKGNKNLSEDKTSIDRGVKESYPAVTNMIGPMPASGNQAQQNARVQSVPVTTKPVLQPNPITPAPQPIGQPTQQVPQGVENRSEAAQLKRSTTPYQVTPNNQVVGNQSVQTGNANMQGQINYNQNMTGVPTMSAQPRVEQPSVSMNGQQPMRPMTTVTPQPNSQVGQTPSRQSLNANVQGMQVPANGQVVNQPMSMNGQPQNSNTPKGQSQTGSSPTDIFGQNGSFQ